MQRALTPILVAALSTCIAACQSSHPMQPHAETPPTPPSQATPEPPPSAWPEAVPVPEKAVEACAGRGAGESCWLYGDDNARNGDCVALPTVAGQAACWTASAR